jgi:hypothetical protein
MGKKIVRLTESDLIRLVKRVINEQPKKDYWDMAKKLDSAMAIARFPSKGGDASQKDAIASILYKINSADEWKELERAFGSPNEQNLDASLQRYLGTDYLRIMRELKDNWEKHGF